MELDRIGALQFAAHDLFLRVCYRCLLGTMSSLHRWSNLHEDFSIRSSSPALVTADWIRASTLQLLSDFYSVSAAATNPDQLTDTMPGIRRQSKQPHCCR